MRIETKLAVLMAALLVASLSFFVRLTSREFLGQAQQRRDDGLQAAWNAAADRCAQAWQMSKGCEDALRAAAIVAEPAALKEAMVLNDRGRIILHTDFFHGDTDLRGTFAAASFMQAAAQSQEPLRQDGVPGPLGPRRVYSAPVRGSSGTQGAVIAVYLEPALQASLDWIPDKARRRQRLALLLGLAVGILSSTAISWSLLSPLEDLAAGAKAAAAGEFAHRVPANRSDELGALAREFNGMMARLAEVDELKDHFVAQVTHDLRGPLSALLGEIELLEAGRRGRLDSRQQESIAHVRRCGRELGDMIGNILDISRLEAGALRLDRGRLDAVAAVESALDALRGKAEGSKITLESHLAPELAEVDADPQALRRILMNLLTNALKFTPPGGHVSVLAYPGGKKEVVFTVSDTGPGIPPERIGALFKKFSQIPRTRLQAGGVAGVGLGLSICRELVEAHGGRIWAESKPGEGARFRFTLPAA